MAVSKVTYGGSVLIDLTQDTAVESDVASGKKFHKADGTAAVGTGSGGTINLQNKTVNLGSAAPAQTSADDGYDGLGTVSYNTSNIDASTIKTGSSVCGVAGSYEGIIPTGNKDIDTTSQVGVSAYATARISATERAKIIAGNIKSGVTILGVAGTYSGIDTSDATATAADIIASKTAYVNGVKLTGTAKSEETIYAELLASDWGTPVYTVTKGTITGYAIQTLETANVYIKKDTAPSSGSDFDYEVDGDGGDYDTIPSAFTASKLYIWRGSVGEASITSPVTQTIPEGYANAYVLTPTTNVTLSLYVSDEDY